MFDNIIVCDINNILGMNEQQFYGTIGHIYILITMQAI